MQPDLPVDLTVGDRVALLVPGSVAYVELVIALLRHGVFPVPMDPGLMPSEREALLSEIDPVRVVSSQEQVEELARAFAGLGAAGPPLGRPIHLTSGTTGRPKGVFSGLLEADDAEALVTEERDLWGFRADDVNLVLSPLHHSAPLRFAVGTLLAGGRVVVPGPFDPAQVSEAIERERPTSMFCVPAHLQRLFAHWDALRDSGGGTPDLSSFRLVAHAGAPCPEWVKRRLVEEFPDGSTWEFYGSTEGQFTACRSEEWLERPGTLGRARPGRVMSTDDEGRLWCVVPAHARFSYLGDPGKTAEAWRDTPEGPAFTVGDLGRVDEDGYVHLDGRREDLVISGGVNVYPAEVERVLAELDGVEDVAVFGRDDDRWGQRVCAAVVGSGRGGGADVVRPRAPGRGQAAQGVAPARLPAAHADRQGAAARPARPRGGSVVGFSRAELDSFRDATVPDLLPARDLRLLFVGINPGLWTAAVQTHFAHPANRFYPALLRAGIVADPVDPSAGMTEEDRERFTRARPGHHQPRPARHRPRRGAHPRRAPRWSRAPGAGRRTAPATRGRRPRHHRLPLRLREGEGRAGAAGGASRGRRAVGRAQPQRTERPRDDRLAGRRLRRAGPGGRSAPGRELTMLFRATRIARSWLTRSIAELG